MSIDRRLLRALYLLTGVLALLLTGVHVLPYLGAGAIDGTMLFWDDALRNTNPAGRFLAIDILFLALAVIAWMVFEARRLSIRFVWLYVIAGAAIGISLAVPLFLAARETALIRGGSSHTERLAAWEIGGLLLLAAAIVGAGVVTALQTL